MGSNDLLKPDEPKPEPTPEPEGFRALTLDQVVRALVYQDHLGRSWYAYFPSPDDSLDAGGGICFSECDTQEEAQRYVMMALVAAANRPNETAEGMIDILE